MYKSKSRSWTKHLDFIILDIAAMYVAYIITFILRDASFGGFFSELNLFVLGAYAIGNFMSATLLESYKNVLKRGYYKEFVATVYQSVLTTGFVVVLLYMIKLGGAQSRLQIFITAAVYMCLAYLSRLVLKYYLKKKPNASASLLIVSTPDLAEETIRGIEESPDGNNYKIAGLVIIGEDMQGETVCGVKVVANAENVLEYTCGNWVDEVLINIDRKNAEAADELVVGFLDMGITTHSAVYKRSNNYEWKRTIEHIGQYTTITRAMQMMSAKQEFAKRLLDIFGGVVGCLICGILFIFIAPIIYINSPGPVIYTSTRIGKNGRKFRFYKFRSMYLDADARKAEFMAQNRVKDGMMFKLDWDPRIIGNKELPDGTRKSGIGEFIRKTSLDEFPQFWNVLKGDMSLVGTRPPTVDEWEKYELRHRARMAAKPGITGMWQVSGRSEITDFEEVVRLDREYISNWSFGLDLKILFKTVAAVIKRKGSM